MAQQAGEQVQALLARWGEPVHPVPDLQELQQGRVLRALSVRVVQLQDEITNGFGVKVHAVAEHLDAIDLHVAQVSGRVHHLQWLVIRAVIDPGTGCLHAAPQVYVDRFKKGLPLVPQC